MPTESSSWFSTLSLALGAAQVSAPELLQGSGHRRVASGPELELFLHCTGSSSRVTVVFEAEAGGNADTWIPVKEGTSHHLQRDEPAVVVEAIREVVESVGR